MTLRRLTTPGGLIQGGNPGLGHSLYGTASLLFPLRWGGPFDPNPSVGGEAVAALCESRLEGDALRHDQILDVYRDTWRGKKEAKFFNDGNENPLLKKSEQRLTVFHETVDPSVTILGVEKIFELPLGGLPSTRNTSSLPIDRILTTVSISATRSL